MGERIRRAAHVAMLVYGAISAGSWWLTRADASDAREPWILGIVIGVGYAVTAALALRASASTRRMVRHYAPASALLGAAVDAASKPPNTVSALAIVSGIAFTLLLFREPGWARAVAGFLVVALCALGFEVRTWRRVYEEPRSLGSPMTFEAMRVDETADIVEGAEPLPPNASAQAETLGDRVHRFVRFSFPRGTPFATARAAADAWARVHAPQPSTKRLAWGSLRGEPGMVVRSYIVDEPPLLTSADVEDARVATDDDGDKYIALSLGPSGAKRFHDVSRDHVGERVAILFDGAVFVAPVIRAEIDGHELRITGGDDGDYEGIAAGLRGTLHRGP